MSGGVDPPPTAEVFCHMVGAAAGDFLRAYERGEIGRFEAMRGIGVDDYRSFTAALLGSGFHLPRGSEEETAREVADVRPILRRQLEEAGELP